MNLTDLPVDILGTISGFSGNRNVQKVNKVMRQASKGPTGIKVRRQTCIETIEQYCPDIFTINKKYQEIAILYNEDSDDEDKNDRYINEAANELGKLSESFKKTIPQIKALLQDTLKEGNIDPFLMLVSMGDDDFKNNVMSTAIQCAITNRDRDFFISTITSVSIDSEGLLDHLVNVGNTVISLEDAENNDDIAQFLLEVPYKYKSIAAIEYFKDALEDFNFDARSSRAEIFMNIIRDHESIRLSDTVMRSLLKVKMQKVENINRCVVLCKYWLYVLGTSSKKAELSCCKHNLETNLTVEIVAILTEFHDVSAKSILEVSIQFLHKELGNSIIKSARTPKDFFMYIDICRDSKKYRNKLVDRLWNMNYERKSSEVLLSSIIDRCAGSTDKEDFIKRALNPIQESNMAWLSTMLSSAKYYRNSKYYVVVIESIIFRIFIEAVDRKYGSSVADSFKLSYDDYDTNITINKCLNILNSKIEKGKKANNTNDDDRTDEDTDNSDDDQ